jgi:hypothetical protein
MNNYLIKTYLTVNVALREGESLYKLIHKRLGDSQINVLLLSDKIPFICNVYLLGKTSKIIVAFRYNKIIQQEHGKRAYRKFKFRNKNEAPCSKM